MLAAIATLLAPVWGWLAGGAAILVALIGVYFKGKSSGVQSQQQAQVQGRLDAIEEKRKSDAAIDQVKSSDLDKRIDPWLRP